MPLSNFGILYGQAYSWEHGLFTLLTQMATMDSCIIKYTVKPVLVVTSIKQPTCIKQPEESCPKIHRLIYLNCIKQPPAFSSHILSFP